MPNRHSALPPKLRSALVELGGNLARGAVPELFLRALIEQLGHLDPALGPRADAEIASAAGLYHRTPTPDLRRFFL